MNRVNHPLILKAAKEESLYAQFVISTNDYDQVGDLVIPKGLDLSEYKKNPIVFIEHARHNPIPIGKSVDKSGNLDIQIYDDRVEAGCYYTNTDAGKAAYNLTVNERVLRGASIGFRAKAYTKNDKGGKTFHSWALKEWSLTARPINENCWAKAYLRNNNPAARLILKSISGSVVMAPGKQFNTKILNLIFDKKTFATKAVVDEKIKALNYPAPKNVEETAEFFKAIIEDGNKSDSVELETGLKAEVCQEQETVIETPDDEIIVPGQQFCRSFLEGFRALIDSHTKSIKGVEDPTIQELWKDANFALNNVMAEVQRTAKGKYTKADWGDTIQINKAAQIGLLNKAAQHLEMLLNPKRVLFKQDKDNIIKLISEMKSFGQSEDKSLNSDDKAEQQKLAELSDKWYRLTGEKLNVG